jgi:RNA polymerase sigma-70 factor, ECF subfamily
MVTSTFPISLLDSACTPVLGGRSSRVVAKRRQADTVARAQTGDHDAFSELYSKHKRRVFALCMRMVRDFALAEDLTQETFLQVYRKIASFRSESAFTTWLHRLAVNTVLMHLRKRALAVVSLDHLMEDIPEERVGRSFGTRDLMQAGVADRLDIDRVIADMAPGYRSVFLLHDIHGFDHAEIAGMLGCSRGNTKSQLHKARRILRNALTVESCSSSPRNQLSLVPSKARMPNNSTMVQSDTQLRA